jgi:hypothetical protein
VPSRRTGRASPGRRGPFDPGSWRSPLRGPWLTSVLAVGLLVGVLVGLLVVAVTGLLSYAAYDPELGDSNDRTPQAGLLRVYATLFDRPTSPVWLYRVTQGLQVLLGLALIPVVLAKLWSVAPKHVRVAAGQLRRAGAGAGEHPADRRQHPVPDLTGVMNIQYDYAWGFSFYTGHFYAA